MASFNDRGILFVLSAPSGTGKSVITKELVAVDPNIFLSVSVTTRLPRKDEVDASDYCFVSEYDFDEMVERDGFLEWATPLRGSARYGTPKSEVERNLNAGRDVLLEVDWQGLRQVLEKTAVNVVSIYILPPSLDEVQRRLRERGQDTPAEIVRRLDQTIDEARHWVEYDYVVINDDLRSSVEQIRAILTTERLRRLRQPKLSDFVRELTVQKNRALDR